MSRAPVGSAASERGLGARVGALVVALFWAVVFFGVIDLSVVPAGDIEFYDVYVLSTGWGLLFTFLVPLPLLWWAARRPRWCGPQVVAIAGAVLLAGVLAGAPGQALTSLLVAASGLLPGMWRPRPRWSLRALLRPACWGLDALVVLASGAALWYCWRQLDAVRSGAQDDVTLGLAHLPMQAAFGLAVAASAAVALLHSTTREPGWWFAFVSPAVSAGWFGAVARAYPDQVGSVGVVGGTLTLLWAAGLLLAAAGLFLLDRPSRRPSASRGSTGRADPENGAERFAASRPGAPPDDPPGWVDGAPTSSEGQSCAFCGQDDVTWVHPLDGERLTYRVHGKGHTLPAFWTLCDRCEQLHASEDVDAAVEVMRSSSPWSWVADEDVAECLHRPLAVFRSADRGARRLDR